MSPDVFRPGDVRVEAQGLTFVLSEQDAKYLSSLGGALIDENQFWGGLSVRPLNGARHSCR